MKTPLEKLRGQLAPITEELDRQLELSAGERVTFGLFVWTCEGWSFLSNGADHTQVSDTLEDMVAHIIADTPRDTIH